MQTVAGPRCNVNDEEEVEEVEEEEEEEEEEAVWGLVRVMALLLKVCPPKGLV